MDSQTIIENSEVIEMDDLKLKFGGEGHSIEANTLINSLLHFTTIVQELNKGLNTGKKIDIKIKALPKGSFLVHLSLDAQTFLQKAIELFAGPTSTAIANFGAHLAILFGLVKFLKGKEPKEIKTSDDTTTITNFEGDTIVIESLIVNIYENSKVIQEAIEQQFETLENDQNVTSFEILDKKDEPIVSIQREEFYALSTSGSEPALTPTEKEITLDNVEVNISSLDWSYKKRWDVYLNGNKISAKVMDHSFSNDRFGEGDILVVNMTVRQQFEPMVNTYRNTAYTITKILAHHQRPNNDSAPSSAPGLFPTE